MYNMRIGFVGVWTLALFQMGLAIWQSFNAWEFSRSPQVFASIGSVYVMVSLVLSLSGLVSFKLAALIWYQERRIRQLEKRVSEFSPAGQSPSVPA